MLETLESLMKLRRAKLNRAGNLTPPHLSGWPNPKPNSFTTILSRRYYSRSHALRGNAKLDAQRLMKNSEDNSGS